ncbi:thioredoxin [Ancylostoma caninum]|uniref:Thioredoxin n=1 Tax=Ancylostoma caninum TaxID=29170 RepID=A0A368H082_ANCCA|nr:thioredoxin [Ancylostoma caninum]
MEALEAPFFGRMDLDNRGNDQLRRELNVTGTPSIYLFLGNLNGTFVDVAHTEDKLVDFYKKVSNVVVDKVESADQLEKFKDSAYVALLFVVDEGFEERDLIWRIARENYNAHTAYTMKNSDVASQFQHRIVVFRDGKLKKSASPKTINEMRIFVKAQTHFPTYFFPSEAAVLPSLYEDNFIFYIDSLAGIVEVTPWLRKLGDERRGSYAVLLFDYADRDGDRALKFFGVKEGDPGRLRLLVRSEDLHFKMELDTTDPIDEHSVKAWLDRFEKGALKPFLKSQPLPQDWDKRPLKILVGDNYAKVANDTSKHVLVLLHAPGNPPNDLGAKIFEELAELFVSFDDVIISKIDVNENDIPREFMSIGRIPGARFYPKGEKTEIEYTGPPKVEKLKEFLEEKTGYVVPEAAQKKSETEEERPQNMEENKSDLEEPQSAQKPPESHEEL